MPINPKARARNHLTGSSRAADPNQIVDLFGFLGLHQLGPVFEPDPDAAPSQGWRRGRRAAYPPLALLATLASARATGSLTKAVTLLHEDPHLWQRCTAAFERRSAPLPPIPPTRDQVIHFRDRLVQNQDLMRRLQLQFRRLAVGQAQRQGNLNVGVQPNGASPLEAHTIYGDGTIIAKYSDVRRVVDPATGDIRLIGAWTQDPARARIQERASDTAEDDKVSNGMNMVAMHTWTPRGRVTLGTSVAWGGEAWAALELVESLHDIVGDGIHTLIYDRAITGWHVDHLMANCRIQVLGKAVGATAQHSAWQGTTDADVRDAVHRRAAEHDVDVAKDADLASLLRRDVIADMVRYHDRMPLGLCIYTTSKRNFDLVRSWYRELDPLTHAGPQGPCVHRVAVDDGGLYEVEDHPDEEGRTIKTRVLRCNTSTPYQRPDGKWGTENRYLLTCPQGDVEYTRRWEPDGVRYTPDSDTKDRAPSDPVGWRLRPLSRADDLAGWYNDPRAGRDDQFTAARMFSDVYSRRNDAESYNEWYQSGLPHHGRAASLDTKAQELDFLLGALLNNSITWANRAA